jgi:hypothetical protein
MVSMDQIFQPVVSFLEVLKDTNRPHISLMPPAQTALETNQVWFWMRTLLCNH